MSTWEYRAVAVPRATDTETIGALLDRFGNEGWELAANLDKTMEEPEGAPADLRNSHAKDAKSGAVLLAAKSAGIAVHFLIFKRAKVAQEAGK